MDNGAVRKESTPCPRFKCFCKLEVSNRRSGNIPTLTAVRDGDGQMPEDGIQLSRNGSAKVNTALACSSIHLEFCCLAERLIELSAGDRCNLLALGT